jgi:hypothetical protein
MANEIPEGHTPLNAETLGRFSVGPDKHLYLDGAKIMTFDPFESFKRAGWVGKAVATIGGLAAFVLAISNISNIILQWNDRYCWAPRYYSLESKCARAAANPGNPSAQAEGHN